MSSRLLSVERAAFRLPPREREALVGRLVESLDPLRATEIDQAWIEEAERRLRTRRRTKARGIPAAQVFRRIRRELGWKV